MDWVWRPVQWLRRHTIGPLQGIWMALSADHKSVVCALAILAVIVGFEPSIPW